MSTVPSTGPATALHRPTAAEMATWLTAIQELQAAVGTLSVQKTTLSVATASVSFTIPSGSSRVSIFFTAKSSTAAIYDTVGMKINSDATAGAYVYGACDQYSGTWYNNVDAGTSTYAIVGWVNAATDASGRFGNGALHITGWDAPHTGSLAYTSHGGHRGATTNYITDITQGAYTGAAPYTTITLFPGSGANFAAGSQFISESR